MIPIDANKSRLKSDIFIIGIKNAYLKSQAINGTAKIRTDTYKY